MARSFDPNAWSRGLDEERGPAANLMTAMMGIQQRKEAKARQEMLDQIAAEDRQRQIQQEDLNSQIQMAEIQQKVAALTPRPTEQKTTTVQAPAPIGPADQAMVASMPDTAAESAAQIQASAASEVPVETIEQVQAPRQTARVGNLEIPLQYRDDIQAREAEDFQTRLGQERQLTEARDTTFAVPNDPRYGQLAGLNIPEGAAGTALSALLRGERSGVKKRVAVDGAETFMTDQEIAEAQANGQKITAFRPEDPTGMSPRQSIAYMGLTNKYSESPAIKQAQAGIAANMIADQVIANPGNATNQLKAMYQFIKNLDYNSAVREGETALVQLTQGYWDKWGMTLDRLMNKGVVVTPDVAVNLARGSKELVQAWNAQAANREQMLKAQAGPMGLTDKVDAFLGGFDRPWAPGATKDNPVTVKSAQEANQLAPGTFYLAPDGKTRKR